MALSSYFARLLFSFQASTEKNTTFCLFVFVFTSFFLSFFFFCWIVEVTKAKEPGETTKAPSEWNGSALNLLPLTMWCGKEICVRNYNLQISHVKKRHVDWTLWVVKSVEKFNFPFSNLRSCQVESFFTRFSKPVIWWLRLPIEVKWNRWNKCVGDGKIVYFIFFFFSPFPLKTSIEHQNRGKKICWWGNMPSYWLLFTCLNGIVNWMKQSKRGKDSNFYE